MRHRTFGLGFTLGMILGTGLGCSPSAEEQEEVPADCGKLAVAHGNVSTDKTTAGGQATYDCDDGYQLKGEGHRICDDFGNWFGEDPTCEDIDECASDNGGCDVNAKCSNELGSRSCLCNFGFIGNGKICTDIDECAEDNGRCGDPTFVTCINNVGAVPTCADIDECAKENGGCGDSAYFSCADNEGALPSCADIDECVTNHGGCDAHAACANNEGALPTCTCLDGYHGDGLTCQLKDCGEVIDVPANGYVSAPVTTYGSTATYACDVGYTLSGEVIRECQSDATWSGSAPICVINDCGEIDPAPTHGSVNLGTDADGTSNSTKYKAIATYSCDLGYALSGDVTRECQSDTSWSGRAPTCTINDCGDIGDPPNNGTVSGAVTTYGATAAYECDIGYAIDGEGIRECQSDATWSGSAPICVINDCGGLDVTNGRVNAPLTTYGSLAAYSCDPGYVLTGESSRECQSDKAWSGSAPTCAYIPGATCGHDAIYTEDCFPIVPTGLGFCYDGNGLVTSCPDVAGAGSATCDSTAGCGQDGQYPDVNRQVFTCVEGNGDEAECATLAQASDQTVRDNLTGLTWQRSDFETNKTWADAQAHCEALNYDGFSQWRLPSIHELQSLVDDSKPTPPLVHSVAFPNIISHSYWSSTIYEGNSEIAWYLYFDNGDVKKVSKSDPRSVICVRDPEGHDENVTVVERFTEVTIGGDGVVSDVLTGLEWLEAAAADAKSWEDALAYCEGSTKANKDDWRLPNKRELVSLIDYSRYSPASAFSGVSNDLFWASTSSRWDNANAWYVAFRSGEVYWSSKGSTKKVLCVRYPKRDNGDGTITDRSLGLMWMKCPQGMTYNFATKECDGEADLFNFCTTPDNACDSGTADFPGGVLSGEGISELWDACNDLVYAGYEDWRVPTKEELVSVVECNDGKTPGDDETCGSGNYSWPPLDRLVFPGNFPIPWFWTSSVKATDSGAGWFVYFFNGYVTGADKSDDEAAVLCVR